MRTLNEIAREVLVEEGRNTLHKLQHVMQIGSRAMNLLNIDVVGTPKRVTLTPNSYHAIDVPDDMNAWTMVATCIDGYLCQLSEDNTMCLPHMTDDCGNLLPESTSEINTVGWPVLCSYGDWLNSLTSVNQFGEWNPKAFGRAGDKSPFGTFRYDEDRRQIVVSPRAQGRPIALEYITNGLNQVNILVPDDATEAAISFIRWKTAKNLSERRQFKQEWGDNLIDLQNRSFKFTLYDMIAAARSGYYQSAKG